MRRRSATTVLACAAVAGCGGVGAGGRVPVVAAENFYGSIVSQVGGPYVRVTSIIKDPSADPHEYASSIQDTQAVADARLVVVNGAGYDSFMDRLVDAAPASGRTVLHVDRLVRVSAVDPNPHLWYLPSTAAAVARAAERDLAATDPAHASVYGRRMRRFVASLAPISAEIDSLRRRFGGTPFAHTERVAGYLTALIGLRLRTPPGFARADEQGTDPAPRDVATMRALITGHAIRLLLYNRQASSQPAAALRALAQAHGVPVVGVTETPPPGESYQQWQLAQLQTIDRALSGS